MAQWILRQNGKVVVRRSLRRLTPHELSPSNEAEVAKRAAFNNSIRESLGDSLSPPLAPIAEDPVEDWDLELYCDDSGESATVVPEADFCDATGKPILMAPSPSPPKQRACWAGLWPNHSPTPTF